jgi:unsaturated chondroitin disaccharide hydrolase
MILGQRWSGRARLALALVALVSLVGSAGAAAIPPDLGGTIDRDLAFAAGQLQRTVAYLGTRTVYPRSTQSNDGSWKTVGPDDWTSGFFPGTLWLMYQATGAGQWRQWAERWTLPLASQSRDKTTHDVGFRILSSFGNGYRLTHNPGYAKTMLQAAASLATRYNETVGATRSWSWGAWKFPVIIDNMMNIELLFRAADLPGGKPAWERMAIQHSATTLANHVRANGSTFHVVDFDPNTGKVLAKQTFQGYANWSTWARGQAWGLYGFTVAYRETRMPQYRVAAEQLADYFVDHLPADSVPYWDFNAPSTPTRLRDTSAAAIAASGLVELSGLAETPQRKAKYLDAAIAIIRSLSTPAYLAKRTTSRGILLHGVGALPLQTEVDVSLIYGDYYFIEALLRLKTALAAG